MFGDLFPWRL